MWVDTLDNLTLKHNTSESIFARMTILPPIEMYDIHLEHLVHVGVDNVTTRSEEVSDPEVV